MACRLLSAKPFSEPILVLLLNGTLGINLSEILIKSSSFSFKKMHLKISSGKWCLFSSQPQCVNMIYAIWYELSILNLIRLDLHAAVHTENMPLIFIHKLSLLFAPHIMSDIWKNNFSSGWPGNLRKKWIEHNFTGDYIFRRNFPCTFFFSNQ